MYVARYFLHKSQRFFFHFVKSIVCFLKVLVIAQQRLQKIVVVHYTTKFLFEFYYAKTELRTIVLTVSRGLLTFQLS